MKPDCDTSPSPQVPSTASTTISDEIVFKANRREKLCLKFAKACFKNEKLNDMFPKSKKNHAMDKRQNEKFLIRNARTERLQRSAIIHMQRLLNNEDLKKRKIMTAIKNIVPVNYDCH